MSNRPVDEKIVRMKLENQDFKARAEETMTIFGKINSMFSKVTGINFGKAHDDIASLNGAASKVNLGPLSTGVETVAARFTALGAVGFTVMQNLTNKAMEAGEKIVNALGMDGARVGFQEYELKMGSVQTILASSGEELATVNKYLEELNAYSDKTIYSFKDMTSNIGKFTNAGVKLEDAVLAIKGISNEAALSGANAEEASRAMYNFSQALSSGSVKLLDWKSIELANMGTKSFKEELLKTAIAMGTVRDVGDGMYKSITTDGAGKTSEAFNATMKFNEALSSQWMTSEVLVETLKKYADETTDIGSRAYAAAQDVKTFSQMMDTTREAIGSGWAQSWEIVVGDYEESKKLWTDVANRIGSVVSASTNSRNAMLRAFKDAGGIKNIVNGLGNIFGSLGKVFKIVGESWRAVFPKKSLDGLVTMSSKFTAFTEKLKLTDTAAAKLKSLFVGFFSAINAGLTVLKSGGELIGKLIPDNMGDIVLKMLAHLGNMFTLVKDFVNGPTVQSGLRLVGEGFEWIGSKVGQAAEFLSGTFGDGVDAAMTKMDEFKDKPLANPFETLVNSDAFQKVKGFFDGIGTTFTNFKNGLVNGFEELKTRLQNTENPFEGIGMSELLGGGFLAGAGLIIFRIFQIFGKINEVLKEPKKWSKSLQELTDSIGKSLENLTKKTKIDQLKDLAVAIAILTVSLIALSQIDGASLAKSITIIAVSMAVLMGTLAILDKLKLTDFNQDINRTLIYLGVTIGLFAGAISKLRGMSPNEILGATTAVGVMSLLIAKVVEMLTKASESKWVVSGDQTKQTLLTMIGLVVVISAVTSSIKKLGNMEPDALLRGLAGTISILGVLIGAFALLGKAKLPSLIEMQAFMKFSSGLAKSAVAMLVFSMALRFLVKTIEGIGQIDTGVLTKGLIGLGVMLAEVALFQRIAGDKGSMEAGIGIAIMAASIGLLVKPLEKIGKMDTKEMQKGLLGLALMLSTIAMALFAAKNTFGGAVGILVVTAAIWSLIPAIQILGKMPIESLLKGLGTISWSIVAIALAMQLAKGSVSGAVALVIAAGAITLLAVPLALLAAIPIKGILGALLGLAGAFVIIGVAALVLSPLIPVMAAMALTFGILAIGAVLTGAALSLFAAGLGALGAVAVLSITSIVSAGNILLDAFKDLIPNIGVVIYEFIKMICDTIIRSAPNIADAAGNLIIAFLEGIVKYLPNIIILGITILLKLIEGIAIMVPLLIDAAVSVIISFIGGLAAAIEENGPLLVQQILNLIGEVIILVAQALIALLDSFIGWFPGASEALGKASEAAGDFIRDRFDGETLGDNLGSDFAKGIAKKTPEVKKTGAGLVKGLKEGFKSEDTKTSGTEKGMDFVSGLGLAGDKSKLAGSILGDNVVGGLLTSDMDSIGQMMGIDFSKGLDSTAMDSMLSGLGLGESTELGIDGVDFGDIGMGKGLDFSKGILGTGEQAKTAGSEVAGLSLAGAKSIKTFEAGRDFVLGFVNGISSTAQQAIDAAKNLGTTTYRSLRSSIQERSPSRLTNKSGGNFGAGFINGIIGMTKSAGESAKKLGQTAMESLNGFLDGFDPTTNDAFEFKLKPILDLADMERIKDQSFGATPNFSKSRFELAKAAASLKGPSMGDVQPKAPNVITYEINITAQGDLPDSTIKKMAVKLQNEIKNANDRMRINLGEEVYY